MRRLLLGLALVLGLSAPAQALEMLLLPITTAISATTSPVFQIRNNNLSSILLQGTFTYGSGGTSADAYVQTSIDGGNSWIDVANFHFTTSSAKFVYNLTNAAVTTEVTPSDGSLTANTAVNGILGARWRVKYVTVGTYAGGTTLDIDANAAGMAATP